MTAGKKISLFLLFFCLVLAADLPATEEYAENTGRDCAVCHLDPGGGGELTAAGEGYALYLGATSAGAVPPPPATASRIFRLLVGYLHILFGFFWFGTILYVHLILRPGYASQGLPRGEVLLGLVSMAVMGVTGAILFAYRVPDAGILLETWFGILLLLKIALYLVMVCSAFVAVFVLGPRLRRKPAAANAVGDGDLSLEGLAQYDGKDGRRAFFAYKGVIYDATASPKWQNGLHMGRHPAGGDLTEQLAPAPHGEEKVLAMPRVGQLRAGQAPGPTPPQRAFYAMAYMNLGFVLLITLILACWKWW